MEEAPDCRRPTPLLKALLVRLGCRGSVIAYAESAVAGVAPTIMVALSLSPPKISPLLLPLGDYLKTLTRPRPQFRPEKMKVVAEVDWSAVDSADEVTKETL